MNKKSKHGLIDKAKDAAHAFSTAEIYGKSITAEHFFFLGYLAAQYEHTEGLPVDAFLEAWKKQKEVGNEK